MTVELIVPEVGESITEVQVGTWNGFVFINPDPEAERAYRDSHAVLLRAYGADHPTTRQIAGELADFYEARMTMRGVEKPVRNSPP